LSRRHGSPLHVESSGRGDPPLVLVHGFGASGIFWRKWLPYLEANHRVHAVDLMGFGRSATPLGGDYSPSAQAGHLVELVRRVGRTPPVLIGHSLGAGIVVAAALRLLDEGGAWLPGGLVLISGAVYPQRLPRFLGLARIRGLGELFLLAPPPRFALRWGIRGIVSDGAVVDDTMVDHYRRPLGSVRRRRAILRAARQVSMDGARRVSARLTELRIPTLVLWGVEDRIIPLELGRRLARDLPDARLVTLPGVGHLPPEEAPVASIRPVLEFLDGEIGTRRTAGTARLPDPPG
jgi:pimeloyl-ACP methyl ester carboxylesterase